jgi:hypothetical protein
MTFPGSGLITESLETGDASSMHSRPIGKEIGIVHAVVHLEKGFEL